MFCREQAARIKEISSELHALGAQIIAIGNGTVEMAADFAKKFDINIPLFTDPSRQSYAAAGMKRSLGLGPSSVLRAGRAMASGHRQGKTAGDVWQQGGVVVVSPRGNIVFRHVDSGAGDHADTRAILRAAAGT